MKETDSLDAYLDSCDGLRVQMGALMRSATNQVFDQDLALSMAQRLLGENLGLPPKSRDGLKQNLENRMVVPALKHLFKVSGSMSDHYLNYCRMSPWRTPGAQSLANRLYKIWLLKAVLLLGHPEEAYVRQIPKSLPRRLRKHLLVEEVETILGRSVKS